MRSRELVPAPGPARRALVHAAVFSVLALTTTTARAAEVVFADGRREPVTEPRRDAKGVWTATREGRRTVLEPGDVVAVVDDAGTETVTIPATADPPDAPEAAALLASLRDPKNPSWRQTADQLAERPTKSVLDALVALASDPAKESRRRAVAALARLRTREGVVAAATAILAEKDAALRRESASVLFSVQEIFRRAPTEDVVRKGIADRDAIVRIDFALLAPHDVEAAGEVLRKEGLKSGDHHVRESAAVALGRRGDGAGEGILVGMLARARLPGIDDEALMERLMIREKVEICGILGKLATDSAKAALRKAASAGPEPVRKAAEDALAAAAPK